MSKVSPDDVFNNFKNSLAAVGNGSDKMTGATGFGPDGRPPRNKKRRAPSLEEEGAMMLQSSPETFQQTTELVTLAAQDKAPMITRMSIQELIDIETLQAANDKEMAEMLYGTGSSVKKDTVRSATRGGLRNSVTLGLKTLRNSIMLITGQAEEAKGDRAVVPDLEMGESAEDNMPSAKTADFQASTKVMDDFKEEQATKSTEGDDAISPSSAVVAGGMTLKLVSFDASRPEELESFREKLSVSFMMMKSQVSPIQQAITDAMNAAGIAHVATKLDDGSYELSVVNNSSGRDETKSVAFQPQMPFERIAEGSESRRSDSVTAVLATAAAGGAADKENENQPVELTPSNPKSSDGKTKTSSSRRQVADSKANVFNIFLFGKPEFYFSSSQTLIIFISMYIAIWLIYFMPSAIPGGWKVLTLLPGVLSFVTYTYIVKVACFLKVLFYSFHIVWILCVGM